MNVTRRRQVAPGFCRNVLSRTMIMVTALLDATRLAMADLNIFERTAKRPAIVVNERRFDSRLRNSYA